MRLDALEVGVEIDGLSILSGISASFLEARLNVILGPSGSGKTTLLSVLAGERRPSAGTVHLVDESTDARLDPSPRYACWVPQTKNVIGSRSAMDNAVLGALASGFELEVARGRARRLARQLGIEHVLDSPASWLSGGEIQRLGFVRAALSSRPLILADEPTASLDRGTSAELVAALKRLHASAVVIVASHDPIVADAADYIVDIGTRS